MSSDSHPKLQSSNLLDAILSSQATEAGSSLQIYMYMYTDVLKAPQNPTMTFPK